MADFDLIKKAFLIGVGATAVTIDKIQDLVNDLVERGQITQNEAKTLGEELKTKALKEKELLETKVNDLVESTVEATIKRLGLVTQKDLDKLRKELTAKPKATAKKR